MHILLCIYIYIWCRARYAYVLHTCLTNRRTKYLAGAEVAEEASPAQERLEKPVSGKKCNLLFWCLNTVLRACLQLIKQTTTVCSLCVRSLLFSVWYFLYPVYSNLWCSKAWPCEFVWSSETTRFQLQQAPTTLKCSLGQNAHGSFCRAENCHDHWLEQSLCVLLKSPHGTTSEVMWLELKRFPGRSICDMFFGCEPYPFCGSQCITKALSSYWVVP